VKFCYNDPWLANDKFAHLGMWFAFTCLLLRVGLPDFWSALIGMAWGLVWEVMDGYTLFVWNDPAGFSWRDLIADYIGIAGAILIWTP